MDQEYEHKITTESGEKVATALKLDITGLLTETTGLDATHFKVTERDESITVEAVKFLADRWEAANKLLEGMGFDYASGKDGTRFWAMSKPKPKPEKRQPFVDINKLYKTPETKPEKPKKQQNIEKPKTIRETEALLIDKFGATILKSVVVTEDARSINVEPQAKLVPEMITALTGFLTKFGGTHMNTGMPPGYVWVIKKND